MREIEKNCRRGQKVKSSVEGKHVDMMFFQKFYTTGSVTNLTYVAK